MRILSSLDEDFPEVSIAEGGAVSDGPSMLSNTSNGPAVTSMPPLPPEQIVEFTATVGAAIEPTTDDETPESTPPVVVYGDIVPTDQLPDPIAVDPMES